MTTSTSELTEMETHRGILCGLLARQVRLIDLAIGELVAREKIATNQNDEIDTILLMTQGMGVSAHSILKLTQTIDMAVRDCLGISRSIVETAINVAYIIAGGPEVARLAQRHAMQKSFRDLNRSGDFGPIVFKISRSEPLPDPQTIPGLREALDEFSDAKGREVRDWTTDNIDRRLQIIEAKFGGAALNFAAPLALVYRHSSEILHGTYFGVVYFWTAGGQRPSSRADAEWTFFASHLVAAVSAALFAIRGVIEVIGRQYDIPQLQQENAEILRLFNEYFEKHLANLTPDQLQSSSATPA
jgi:hypothetical protein